MHLIDFGNANGKGRLYGLKYEKKSRSSPWLAPEIFCVHRRPPAQDAYSAGYLLSLITVEMEFPEDLGKIALVFLKTDPDQWLTLAAGLARLQALMGASKPDEYDVTEVEAFFSH